MAHRVAALVAHDARLQRRYGVYYAYVFVLLMYIAVLNWAGPLLPGWAIAVVIFSDPAALGFFFLGALMMLEKGEGTRAALGVSPVSGTDYLLAKLATLTAVALVAVAAMWPFFHRQTNAPLLAVAVALTSIQYIGIGVPVALRFRTVTGYLIGAVVFLTPFIAPASFALGDPTPWGLILIPSVAQLKLMMIALDSAAADPATITLALSVSAVAAAAGVWIGVTGLSREFGRK